MLFKKVSPKNLGGGVILFENCIELDWDSLIKKSKELIEEE